MTASENTSQLLRLPPELLHQVLRLVYPADLAILPRVCRELNVFVKGNETLFHDVYLLNLVRSSGFLGTIILMHTGLTLAVRTHHPTVRLIGYKS